MKAEKVYETFEMPNDKALGWKIVGGLAFSFVASLLLIVVALYADIIDRAANLLMTTAFGYAVTSWVIIFTFVCWLIFKWAKR